MPEPVETSPVPVVTQEHAIACPYASEVGAIRAWRRMYPVVTSVLGALIISIGAHSCAVSREAGALESDVRHLAARQSEQNTAIGTIRSERSREDSELRGEQSQILIQLGRMDAQLTALDQRMQRVETAVVDRGSMDRRRN